MDTTPDTLMPSVAYSVDTGQGSFRRALTMLYRRRWWVSVPALLVTIAFGAVAYWMPPRYRSEVLLSSGAVVNRDLEGTDPVLDVQRQLTGISEVVKRRSLLEQVIREFELYPLADDAGARGRPAVDDGSHHGQGAGQQDVPLSVRGQRPPPRRRGGHQDSPTW